MAKSKQTGPVDQNSAATAVKRKVARQPPVIDRAGVTMDSSDSSGSDVTTDTAPEPLPAPTTTASSTSGTLPPLPVSISAAADAGTTPPPDPSTVPFAGAAPKVSVPVPPAGFVPVPVSTLVGYRPMQSELAAIPDAIYELAAFPNWGLIFGITAPSSTSIGGRLSVASGWTTLLAQSNSWTSYVKSQEGMSWKDALEVLESLKPAFQLAVAASPSIANQYPALTRLLGAQKVVAKRAVSTKKRNAAAATAASTTATTAATAPAAAAPAPDATSTTAGRVVTVQG